VALELDNKTPFSCAHPPLTAKNGANILRVTARATYDVRPDGALRLAAKQAPIRVEDVYWGEPGKSSIRYECDIALERPFTDVIVNGQAHAPKGRAVTATDVGLMIGKNMVRRLRVTGDRRWMYGVAGWKPSDPKPFVTMPVIYDRAFGGMDAEGSEARNRCGTGYASRIATEFAGTALPNVEVADALINSPKQRPQPGGMGILCRDWQSRARFAGTYDKKWLDERMPLLPPDFDDRFNQCTPEDQWLRGPAAGTRIAVSGMSPAGVIGFEIPRGTVRLEAHYRKKTVPADMTLESVLLDCERRQVELTWRHSVDIHGDPFQLNTVLVKTDAPELLAQDLPSRKAS
jgi:hypothetical protein